MLNNLYEVHVIYSYRNLTRVSFMSFHSNIFQTAVRGWLARRHTNVLRKKVCSAVLIQSAWRSYISRKRLLLLKQAAIILQAHWRGRAARKRCVHLVFDLLDHHKKCTWVLQLQTKKVGDESLLEGSG